MNEYECQDCGHRFQSSPGEEPECPECSSQSIVFEGKRQLPLWKRTWLSIRPVVYFLFTPWKFFPGRSLAPSTGVLLAALMVFGFLSVPYQAFQETAGSYFLRDPGIMLELEPAVPTGEVAETAPEAGWSLNQAGAVYGIMLGLELIWFGSFLVLLGRVGDKKNRQQIVAILAGTFWIPNLLFAGGLVAYTKSIEFGLWPQGLELSFPTWLPWIVYGFLLYWLVSGTWSLGFSVVSWLKRFIAALAVQLGAFFGVLWVSHTYLLPAAGITGNPNVSTVWEMTLRYWAYPFIEWF